MEGVEIVITPRTIERIAFSALIVILLVLLILKWGDNCPVSTVENKTSDVTQQVASTPEPENQSEIAAAQSGDKCSNSVKDATETDIDCGGSCTTACAEFKACNIDDDCESGLYCFQHIKCLKPSCDDGLKNQDETNVDCGGVCKGYWWNSDKKCHATKEPSGRLDITTTADIGRSLNSGNAIINSVTLNLDNGLDKDLSLTAYFYARYPDGDVVFENQEGEIAISTATLSVKNGEKISKTIDMSTSTRSTLPGIKSTEEFQILIILKDNIKKTTIDEFTWTNS